MSSISQSAKTKGLGLSNLVIGSFDKETEQELEANGWQLPPPTVPSFSLPLSTQELDSPTLVQVSNLLHSRSSQVPSPPPPCSASDIVLEDFGPCQVKKESRAFLFKRTSLTKRVCLLSGFQLKLSKEGGEFKAYKTVHVHDISQIIVKEEEENEIHLHVGKQVWKLVFATRRELYDFAAFLALRVVILEMLEPKRLLEWELLVSLLSSDVIQHAVVVHHVPLLLFAWQRGVDKLCVLLLKRGANPSCLLRIDTVCDRVQTLLEEAQRDLNVVGDDSYGLTLLHYFLVTRKVSRASDILLKIDRPFAERNMLGETPYSILLRQNTTDNDDEKVEKLCRLLLEFGVNPNLTCDRGDSAYHLCVRSGNDSLCVLLESFAPQLVNLNQLDFSGNSPMHLALRARNMACCKRLLPLSNLLLRDNSGDTSLLLAMKLHEESFAVMLVHRQAKLASMRSHESAPLILAISLHQPSLCLLLLDVLPDADIVPCVDDWGRSALQLSLLHNLLGVTHKLVAKILANAAVGVEDDDMYDPQSGDNAMLLAIRAGRLDVATSLMPKFLRSSRNSRKNETCLHAGARLVERTYNTSQTFATLEFFKAMVHQVAHNSGGEEVVNARTFQERNTVLHQIVSCAEESCGMWLLEALLGLACVSYDIRNAECQTPLSVAFTLKRYQLARLLMNKSNLNLLVGKEESYLHMLVRRVMMDDSNREDVSILETLLAHPLVYTGRWDANGETPLHVACKSANATVALLLKYLAPTRLNDRTETDGLTPLQLCLQFNNGKGLESLLGHGADHRLVQPRQRQGLYQRCEMVPDAQSCFAILHRLVPLEDGDEGEMEAQKRLLLRFPIVELEHNEEEKDGTISPSQSEETTTTTAAALDEEEAKSDSPQEEDIIPPLNANAVMMLVEEIQAENPMCSFETALEVANRRRRRSPLDGKSISKLDFDLL